MMIATLIVGAATGAQAHPAKARLVNCDAGNCLLVRGHRPSSSAIVRINDHVVEVRGRHSWQVSLPVATVEAWSAPFARTLRVSVLDPAGPADLTDTVRLPTGLLGHNQELALLVVHAR